MKNLVTIHRGPSSGSTEASFQDLRSPNQGTLSNGMGDSEQYFTGQGEENLHRFQESELKRAKTPAGS